MLWNKPVILLFFLFCFLSSYSQVDNACLSCLNNYFIKFYNNANLSLEPGEMAMDGNDVVTCGFVRLAGDGYIMRINSSGNIIWQKTIGGVGSQGLRRMLKLSDGNFVATGFDSKDNYVTNFLIKFDGNGNIIWRKDFGTSNDIESISIASIVEDDSGSIIIVANNYEADPWAHFRILFAKFDSKGSIILSKFFVPPFNSFGGVMNPHDCIVHNGYTYIAGNLFTSFLQGLLMKVNNTSGDLEWAKLYDFNNDEADFTQLFSYADDKLCIIGADSLNPDDTSLVYIADTNGVIISTKYYQFNTILNGEHSIYGKAAMDKDKNLVWGMLNYKEPYTTSTLTLSKINPVAGALWKKDILALRNMPRTTSVNLANDNSIYVGGYNLTNSEYLQFYLGKFNKNGDAGCKAGDLSTSFGDGSSNVTDVVFSAANKTLVAKTNSSQMVNNYVALADSSCTLVDICNNLKLTGADKVCANNTFSLQFSKNAACNATPVFNYDSTFLKLLSYTGKKATFRALKPGMCIITASLEGSCTLIADSLKITIQPGVTTLDLGASTVLCKNDSIRLNAKSGYASYVWQNGSTDSILLVKTPGKYYITVSDFCGNIQSDTVIISAANAESFNFLPLYTKCNKDSIHTTVPSHTNYTFLPSAKIMYNAGMITAWPLTSTSYSVRATTAEGCTDTATLNIKVNAPGTFSLGSDTAICIGDTIVLKAPAGFYQYTWNDGSSLPTYPVSKSGRYWVKAEDNNGCISFDALNIKVNNVPKVNLRADSKICPDSYITLKAGGETKSYLWQDGSTAATLRVDKPGTYWVTKSNGKGCSNSDTIQITGYKNKPTGFLNNKDSICTYESKNIYAKGNWSSYLWSTGSTSPSITITQSGNYWLKVSNDEGCYSTDTIQLFNKNCMEGIFFPTAFTPNGDGKNDVYKPVVHVRLDNYHFVVYNRFGEKVFETKEINKGWDGKLQAIPQDGPVTFVWYCIYKPEGGAEQTEKGTVVLIR
jgi:gliding motility-associated-like protein